MITREGLKTAWETLYQVAEQYYRNSDEWADLIKARRLIEVEMRAEFGDKFWEEVTQQ